MSPGTTTTDPVDAESPRAGDRFAVVVGPGELRRHRLAAGRDLVFGRAAGCDVVIADPRVSRRHARLWVGDLCTIEDLGSRHGTLVGGQPVPPGGVVIEPGAPVSIGPYVLVIVTEDRVAMSPAPSSLVVDDPAPASPPALLVTVARSPLTVLIRGESGSGKEVLADTLHALSGRAGPLLRLNCATFSAELLESELFGHERGAFTGAVAAKPGLLEVAAGGTVFLDEIGELPAPLQARLLRAIEGRSVLRVGGTRPLPIDVRFLAATHRDLGAEIARGTFRLDLYYRLAVVTLTVPPLRARPERIVDLAHHLAAAAADAAGRPPPRLTAAAIDRLQAHGWPGNVRELRNVIERGLLLADGDELTVDHIVLDAPAPAASAPAPAAAAARDPTPPDGGSERSRILDALGACAGNQTRAARLLGMSRATLAHKLVVHRIPRPRRG